MLTEGVATCFKILSLVFMRLRKTTIKFISDSSLPTEFRTKEGPNLEKDDGRYTVVWCLLIAFSVLRLYTDGGDVFTS